MKTYSVTLLPQKVTVSATQGQNLLALLQKEGFAIDAPCGGNGNCGKCRVRIDGKEVLACRTEILRNMTVMLPQKGQETVLTRGNLPKVDADGENRYAIAFDLGTTTVAGFLLDGRSGSVLAKTGAPNPQRSFGADVISRIRHVILTKDNTLHTIIKDTLGAMAVTLTEKAGIAPEEVTVISLAGNPAMHHLALGIDPKPLTVPPYMPAVFHSLVLEEGWLEACPKASVRVMPNIAGFVGGDTVACMVSTELDKKQEITLLLDIGTNGELVLATPKGRLACSCAAGPALEGAGISRGMSAMTGAVDRVWRENGELRFHTVGEAEAAGLCGSGILDLIAVLLELGVIDSTGFMREREYVIPGTDLSLTRQDIRQIQLAKSAIRTGIELLCAQMEIGTEDIQQVLLAGAFGSRLNSASACRLGLLPPVLEDRVLPVGNAAGMGAAMCAVSKTAFDHGEKLAEATAFLELAAVPEFQDRYIENLNFESCAMERERKTALSLGFTHAAVVDTGTLVCKPEVRQMCKEGCGQYKKRWSCPPACGSLEDCRQRLSGFDAGILVQTVGVLEDEFDGEGMMAVQAQHNARFALLVEQLRQEYPKLLAVGTGCCTLCPECTYPGGPCRFPEKCFVPMEAYGLLVAEVCKENGLKYYHGQNTITYTACILLKS